MGLLYWLLQLDIYYWLLCIGVLQQEIWQCIVCSGGVVVLVEEVCCSVICDVLDKQFLVVWQNDVCIVEKLQCVEVLFECMNQQFVQVRGDVIEMLVELWGFVVDFFVGLILQVKGVDCQIFIDFYECEIGVDGIMLFICLQNEFEQCVKGVNLQMVKVQFDVDIEVNYINVVMCDMGKQGLQYVLKGNLINNGLVLVVCDGIVGVVKVLGMDGVGKVFKFKFWGVVKFVKVVNGVLVFVGVVMEIWDSWNEVQCEKVFQMFIVMMVILFEDQCVDLLMMLQGEQVVFSLFLDYQVLEVCVQVMQVEMVVVKECCQQFQVWNEEVFVFDVEFKWLFY